MGCGLSDSSGRAAGNNYPWVNDPDYENWLKVILVLHSMKLGINSFLKDEVGSLHQSLVHKLGKLVRCTQCDYTNVTWKKTKWKFTPTCPNNVCNTWFRELRELFDNPKSRKIYWSNCDITSWPFLPWECAKLFMSRGQQSTNTGPNESDAQALLTLMRNCKHFHGKLSGKGLQLICEISETRNRVFHSPDLKLSDSETRDSIDKIIQLLEDPNVLGQQNECKAAVSEIKKIRDDSVDIFPPPTLEVKALRESVKEIRRELGISKTETGDDVNSLKEELTKLRSQIAIDRTDVQYQNTAVEKKINLQDTRQNAIEGRVNSLEIRQRTLEARVDSQETRQNDMDGRVDSTETKQNAMNGHIDSLKTRHKDMNGRVDSLETTQNAMDGRVGSIETRQNVTEGCMDSLNKLEKRVYSLETAQIEIGRRLDSHDRRFDSVENILSAMEKNKDRSRKGLSRDDDSGFEESGQQSSTDKCGNKPQGVSESETGYESSAKRMVENVVMNKQVDKAVKHPDLQKLEFVKVLEAELGKCGKTEVFFTTDPLPFKSQSLSDGECRTFLQCLLKENTKVLEDLFVLLECDHENCEVLCWKCKEKQNLCNLALYYGHFDIAEKLIHMNVDVSIISLCNAARHGNLTKIKEILETLKRNNAFHPSMENAKLALCRAYITEKRDLVDYLSNEGIRLDSHHIKQIVEDGSMAVLKDVFEHLKYHERWQPKYDADKVVYNESNPPVSEALLKAFISGKIEMATLLIKEGVGLTMNVLPRVSENGFYDSILRVMQHLEENMQWDPKSAYASRALEIAYVMRKEDICDLLIQEGVQLSMENIPGIVRKCSLETVDKVIKYLKEANKWDPKSDCAIEALQITISNGDISGRLFQEGVPLTMENFTLAIKNGSPMAVTDIIKNLKANKLWDAQSDRASKALEYAYRATREDVCELLIEEGTQLKMKNFPGIVQDQTQENVKKVLQTMKENGNWEPESRFATEAIEIAFTKNKNNICDLLIREGVSPTMRSLDAIRKDGSIDIVSKFIQRLKDTNKWRRESKHAKKALENAFKRQDGDMSALLIKEAVFISMKPLSDIVKRASLDTNRKVVEHLKDNRQWNPYSDDATCALASAFKEQRYEICDFLIKEEVSLKMENLPELLLTKSSECLFKAIQHLKCKNQWESDSNCAYDAFTNACMDRMYEVCDLLTAMGVSLAMEKLLDIVRYGTLEHVSKVIQHMKKTCKWEPNSIMASEALKFAKRAGKNDIRDLLIQEGVSSAPSGHA